ncbi:MAG: twin-arginine translocase subunit TatC [Nitrospirae bacterium]|nr:twin-arginine translocase subunit TatC [Nitrospirota bacterium]MBI3593945.1 twin-arginine translocase subunit TatC [Nitrospirota bacterium]
MLKKEPEKLSKTKESGTSPEKIMPVTAHLIELRSRVIKSLIILGIFFAVALQEVDTLLNGLRRLLPADLYFNSPAEALWVSMKIAFFASLFVSFPFILYQTWRFISPGLLKKERRIAIPFVFGGSLFFIFGVSFSYFIVLPFALNYLIHFGVQEGIKPQIVLTQYVDFILKLMLAFGLIFIIPIALILLGKAGFVTSRWLAKNRKYAILINSIVAAVLTPTPDVFNMMLMMIPLVILYEIGIWGIRLFGEGTPRSESGE